MALFLVLCGLVVCANQSEASTKVDKERVLLESFYGFCYLNIEDLEKVRAAARELKWQELSEDAWKMLGGSGGKGWWLRHNSLTMMLGINTGEFRGKKVNICSLATAKIDPDKIIKLLERDFSLQLMDQENDVYQQWRFYRMDKLGEKAVVYSITWSDMISIGIMK